MFLKSAKSVFDMVIVPVQFRKTGFFATWWRFMFKNVSYLFKMRLMFISCLKPIFNF